jgi:hypothetical protein
MPIPPSKAGGESGWKWSFCHISRRWHGCACKASLHAGKIALQMFIIHSHLKSRKFTAFTAMASETDLA